VPWVPVSTSPRINLFKWNDWAQSLNMAAPEFNFFGMMGVSDFIRAAIHDAATMKEIASYVDKGANPAIGQIEHEQGGLLVRMSNWMLENLVPKRFRYGVDRLLMSKIGPACDHVLNRLAALGLVMPGVRRNARKLAELSKLPGTLSGEDICAVRRRQIHERIAELNQQLAADYQQKTVSPS